MNNTFDIGRFGKYFVYATRTNARKGLMGMGAIVFILLAIYMSPFLVGGHQSYDPESYLYHYYDKSTDPMWGEMFTIFISMFIFVLPIISSLTFNDLVNKPSRIESIMLPASQLEKFLVRWVMFVPIAFIGVVVSFEIVDLIRMGVMKIVYPSSELIHPFFSSNNNELWNLPENTPWIFWGIVLALQAFLMLCSILWPKLTLLKGILSLLALSFIFTVVAGIVLSVTITPEYYYHYEDRSSVMNLSLKAATVAFVLGCYILSYFRYKEIEIIQRW